MQYNCNGVLHTIRGHRLQFLNKFVLFFSEDNFCLNNNEDPDEMPHYAKFNLGLLYLQL